MDLIVLSPHLDDGVFSCGGQIAKTTAHGGHALIVTFFTGEPNQSELSSRLRKFYDYNLRKAEDSRAAEVLGARVQWLDLVERGFRSPPLSGFAGVFRAPDAGSEAFDYLVAIQSVISGLLDAHPNAQVLAPLAAGNHIDHVEVFVAAVNVLLSQRAFDRLRFYEDAYAIGARVRKQHFVTRRHRWSRKDAPERQSVRYWAMFNALAFVRRGPPVERLLPIEAQSLRWEYEAQPIAEFEARKLEAVVEYHSQVAMLGGADAWCELLRRYHSCWGVAEPIWRTAPVAA